MEQPLIETVEGCITLGRLKERESVCEVLGISKHADPILAIKTRENLTIEAVKDRDELKTQIKGLKTSIRAAMLIAGGRWSEWGQRAELVRDKLESIITQ